MHKRLLLLIFMLALMGCNTTQTVVRTTKPTYKKPASKVATTAKKPTQTKPSTSKSTASKSTPSKTTSSKPISAKTSPNKTIPVVVATKKAEEPIKETPSIVEIKKIEEKYEAAKEENKSNANETVYSKTEILEATTRVKVTTAMVLDYIATYKDVAENNMKQYGIPSSIILGQGILESGAGTGPLSVLANNHFGIKCHKDWNGPSIKYDDDEEQECFRKYDQAMESFQDHSQFLINRTWYAPLFQLEKDDYKQWARGLKNAGYATDPKYPEKLIAIIERYQLYQYDAEVLGKPFTPVNFSNQVTPSSNADLYQVSQGDTLYSISKKFNISIDDLKRKNNIQDNALSIGQNIKVK
nr:glucosaminidase domain-containing protein [Flavobacterium sp.]